VREARGLTTRLLLVLVSSAAMPNQVELIITIPVINCRLLHERRVIGDSARSQQSWNAECWKCRTLNEECSEGSDVLDA
jgi:hypothetical protein